VTPHELAISAQSIRHSLVSDEAPTPQVVGVATIMANELVADSIPNAAVLDSVARLGPGRRPVKES
jgi:hypothetical protein